MSHLLEFHFVLAEAMRSYTVMRIEEKYVVRKVVMWTGTDLMRLVESGANQQQAEVESGASWLEAEVASEADCWKE